MMKRKNSSISIEYKRIAIILALILFFSFLLFFTYTKTKHIWSGINLVISYPENNSSIEEDLIYIEGSAPKAIKLTINQNDIFVGSDGSFSSPIPVHDGYNEIHIEATDKFKNTTKEILKINGIIN